MNTTKKISPTKNQHYVPQFYLRNFSIDKKNIGTYLIKTENVIPLAPIKSQSSGDYFYSDKMDIEKALARIESFANIVINKIIANPQVQLSKDEQYVLYVFTFIQQGRTLGQIDSLLASLDSMIQNVVKIQTNLLRENGKEEDGEELTDEDISTLSLSFNKPGLFTLGTQAQLLNICLDLKCKILINKTTLPFITSDNPVVLYDQFMERMGNQTYGLGARGLQMYLPLTPQIGIMYYDDKCYKLGHIKYSYVDIKNENDINELNKLAAVNSREVLYFKPSTISEYKLTKLVNNVKKHLLSNQIETLSKSIMPDSNILCVQRMSKFCKLRLSFVKELPVYKAIHPKDFDINKHLLRCNNSTQGIKF